MKLKKIVVTGLLGLLCLGGITTTLVSCKDDDTSVTQADKYTVTFNSNGGSEVKAQEVENGKTVAKPTNPTRDGYTFKGWYTDSALTKEYDFKTVVTGNLTLYAKWEKVEEAATKVTVTFNSNGGSEVASQTVDEGAKVTKPGDPTRDGYTFGGWYTDEALTTPYNFESAVTANLTLYAKWNEVVNVYKIEFVTGDESIPINPVEVNEGDTPLMPADPTRDGYTFGGWFTDEEFKVAFDAQKPVTANVKLYAKWDKVVETETLTRTLDVTRKDFELTSDGKTTKDEVVGYFTLEAGMKPESKTAGDCYNTQGKLIKFTTTSAGKLTVNFEGASGSLTKWSIYDEDGVELYTEPFTNANGQVTKTWDIPKAGTYSFGGDKSVRVYSMSYTETVEKSEPVSITVTARPEVNFLEGRAFDASGLQVSLNYENGRVDLLESGSYQVDSSAYKTTPGQYEITITATVNEQPFTTKYTVTVYQLESVSLDVFTYGKDGNKYTDLVFFTGEDFTYKNLTVVGHGVYGTGDEKKTCDFLLEDTEYGVTAPDLATEGNKVVQVKSKIAGREEVGTQYLVGVVDKPEDVSTIMGVFAVSLKDEVLEATSTYKNKDLTGDENLYYAFPTIMMAHQFYEKLELNEYAQKNIGVVGTHEEKVDITLPNVQITGINFEYMAQTIEKYGESIITYGDVGSKIDMQTGAKLGTQQTGTLNVRASAEGFRLMNIRVENQINTYEEFQKLPSNDTQAVALYVQADMTEYSQVTFSGYQDTIYMQSGKDNTLRAYFNEVYVEGRTDTISADGGIVALFKGGEIKTIGTGDEKNGGYIIAAKGLDGVAYGLTFDEVHFSQETKDVEGVQTPTVVAGTTSIARAWGADMKIMIMNSTLDGHISKEVYGDTVSPKNNRYMDMNAKPNPANLFEYNNNGDGAVLAEDTTDYSGTFTKATADNAPKWALATEIYRGTNTVGNTNNWIPLLYPEEDENFVTISFQDVNGNHLTSIKEIKGEKFSHTLPTVSAPGQTFDAWYTSQTEHTEENKFNNETVVTESLTVYPGFVSAVVAKDVYDYDVASLTAGDYTAKTAWNSKANDTGIVSIIATGESKKLTVEANGKTIDDLKFTHRLKLGGAGKTTERSIEIDLSSFDSSVEYNIVVYAMSGSSKDTRALLLTDADGQELARTALPGDKLYKTDYTVTLKGGNKYYVYGEAAINVYGLTLTKVNQVA